MVNFSLIEIELSALTRRSGRRVKLTLLSVGSGRPDASQNGVRIEYAGDALFPPDGTQNTETRSVL